MAKVRLDTLLHERGLFPSRSRAAASVMAGEVRLGGDGRPATKPGQLVDPDIEVAVAERPRYVSRGGMKLAAALEALPVPVEGRRCLDVGASTGGFTDCLLQHGAASVIAVDVGRGQLHIKLRNDPRVTLLEGVNARDLTELPPIDFFVADLSFISLRKVLPSVARRTPPGTPGIVLLKPQFEAGPADVPRGGVIKDVTVRERVLSEFVEWARSEGWTIHGTMESPVPGSEGNIEYLVRLDTPKGGAS